MQLLVEARTLMLLTCMQNRQKQDVFAGAYKDVFTAFLYGGQQHQGDMD